MPLPIPDSMLQTLTGLCDLSILCGPMKPLLK